MKFYFFIRRIIDTIIALVSLIVLSPILLIVAIAICLESKGGAIFKQKRIGLNGKPYDKYKFRSMVKNAQNIGTGVYSFEGDPRITKVGHFIRRTSIDELPQLWNIVKGDMFFSGVGSKQSIKKRYKDLIKIYHPDNLDGDKDTIHEINSEYNKLCAMYKI